MHPAILCALILLGGPCIAAAQTDPVADIIAAVQAYNTQRGPLSSIETAVQAHPEAAAPAAKRLMDTWNPEKPMDLPAISFVLACAKGPEGVPLLIRGVREHPDFEAFGKNLEELCHDLCLERVYHNADEQGVLSVVPRLVAEGRLIGSTTRPTCLRALGKLDDRRCDSGPFAKSQRRLHELVGTGIFEVLSGALGDTDRKTRWDAANALGAFADPRAIAVLLPLLGDPDAWMRSSAVSALGDLGDRSAIDPIIAVLGDSESHVRQHAASVLGRFGDKRAVAPLVELLKKAQELEASDMIEALGRIGDAAAIDPIASRLSDPSENVRRSVAVGMLKAGSAVARLCEVAEHDEKSGVRCAAVEALEEISDRAAVPCLLRILASKDQEVVGVAAGALAAIGGETGISGLLAALRSPKKSTAEAALYALCPRPEFAAHLLPLLDDPRLRVQLMFLWVTDEDEGRREQVCARFAVLSAAQRRDMRGCIDNSDLPAAAKERMQQALASAPPPNVLEIDLTGSWIATSPDWAPREMRFKDQEWLVYQREDKRAGALVSEGSWTMTEDQVELSDGVEYFTAKVTRVGATVVLEFDTGKRWTLVPSRGAGKQNEE